MNLTKSIFMSLLGNENARKSLKTLLSSALAFTTGIALALIFSAFIVYDQVTFQRNLENQLATLAKVTAINSLGAISFNDEDAAKKILESVQAYDGIWHAAILDINLQPLSEIHFRTSKIKLPEVFTRGVQSSNNFSKVLQPIIWQDERLGYVYLLADMERLAERRNRLVIIGSIISLFALFASLLASKRLFRRITLPIFNLASFTDNVSQNQDYSLRAENSNVEETNMLVDGINHMLEEIHRRDFQLTNSEQRLSLALKGAGEGLWDWDLLNNQLYFDSHSCHILGFNQDEMIIKSQQWTQMVLAEDKLKLRHYIRNFIKSKSSDYNAEYRVQKGNTIIWLNIKGKAVSQQNGKATRITGIMRDITQQKKSDEQMKLLATVFNNTSDAVVILDPTFRVLATNKAFSMITGFDEKEMIGSDQVFLSSSNNPAHFTQSILEQTVRSNHWRGEAWDVRKSGENYPIELELNQVSRKGGELTHFVAVYSDITQRKKSEKELFFMANYDPLTGLPNRSMIFDSLKKSLVNAKRKNQLLAIFYLDLDKFKRVNDTMGHEAGDELLRQTATRLQNAVYETDLVGRLSGDEFIIVAESIPEERVVEAIAKRIQRKFQRDFNINGQLVSVGGSIGISLYPKDSGDAEGMLKKADLAMYYSKEKGGNNVSFFDQEMNKKSERRNLIDIELRKALELQQIIVYYQPKVNVNSFKIEGFEALVRWQHPTLGMISPAEFIPVAEDSGLIQPIGLFVVNQACLQLKSWHEQGYSSLHMAINVSAREFQLSDYPINIAKILQQTGVSAEKIELELTETLVMDNPKKMVLMLQVLKNLNLTLCIDDFGTGYSSLSHLVRFPIDVLKVDKSFIDEIAISADGLAITAAIIAMSHKLGMKVVAEGVETLEQLQLIKELNCELVQGFLFSRPVTATNATTLLQSTLLSPQEKK